MHMRVMLPGAVEVVGRGDKGGAEDGGEKRGW